MLGLIIQQRKSALQLGPDTQYGMNKRKTSTGGGTGGGED